MDGVSLYKDTYNVYPIFPVIRFEWKYFTVSLKTDHTLRCLEYICSVSSPLRLHGLSLL